MIAVEEAAYLNDIPFDIEAKNTENKTALQLALEMGVKDITVAVLIYGDPSITSFEEQINQANILLADIQRERNKLMKKASNKIAHMQLTSMRVLQQTNANVGELALQQGDTSDRLNQVIGVVVQDHQAITSTSSHNSHARDRNIMFSSTKTIENNGDGNAMLDLKFVRTEITELKFGIESMQKRLAELEKYVVEKEAVAQRIRAEIK